MIQQNTTGKRQGGHLLRDFNRRQAFFLLRDRRQLTRQEIADELGVSVQTVIKIMDYFLSRGLATELGEADIPLGRRPTVYGFNPGAAHIIAVLHEGNYVYSGLLDLDGSEAPLSTAIAPVFKNSPRLKDFFRQELPLLISGYKSALASLGMSQTILGAGVGLPGVVNTDKAEISFAPAFAIMEPVDIAELTRELAQTLDIPLLFENDVNAAALGAYQAVRPAAKSLLYISLGTGIGAGLVLDGALHRGDNSFAGEIGHMAFRQEDGSVTRLLDLVGLKRLEEAFGFDVSGGGSSNGALSGYLADILARATANISLTVDVNDVIFGGITVDALGEPLIEGIHAAMKKYLPFDTRISPSASLKPGLRGLAEMVIEANSGILLGGDD